MSRPRTSIRRMWTYDDARISTKRQSGLYRESRVLVIPDNPAARAAMIDRVLAANHAPGSGVDRIDRATVEYVLATALTP